MRPLRFVQLFRSPLLDYPLHNMNKWLRSCRNRYSFRLSRDTSVSPVEYRRVYCDRWSCTTCGEHKALYLRDGIATQIILHGLNRSLTLTIPPSSDDFDINSFKHIKSSWRCFHRSIMRETASHFPYIWILGLGEVLNPHFHVLVDDTVPKADISKTWQKCGGGTIVDIRPVDNHEIAADYYACNLLASGYPRNVRRYGSSRDINISVPRLLSEWRPAPGIANMSEVALYYEILSRKFDSAGKTVYCLAYKINRQELEE